MRIYEQITEGQIVLWRCQSGCGLWYRAEELCTNEETFKLECDECYLMWQAEQEDCEEGPTYEPGYTAEEINEMYRWHPGISDIDNDLNDEDFSKGPDGESLI